MHKEYNIEKLLNLNYQEIVDYLLSKYGLVNNDYMTKSWTPRILSIKKELFLHHIDSNKIANLSNVNIAKTLSIDYQKSNRLVYCDILEHLILHIKITELNDWDGNCGIEDIYTNMIPKLNDICSGFHDSKKHIMLEKIEELKNQYLKIIQYIKQLSWSKTIPILSSYNSRYEWNEENNLNIYNDIKLIGFNNVDTNIKFNKSKLSIKQQKNIKKFINNIEIWKNQKEKRIIRKEISYKNSLIKAKEKKYQNSLKLKAKKLSEHYFRQWNINNNNFENETPYANLKLKSNLTVDEYLQFIEEILNDEFCFFTYENEEFQYFGFQKNNYDKYLEQYSNFKSNNKIYEIKNS